MASDLAAEAALEVLASSGLSGPPLVPMPGGRRNRVFRSGDIVAKVFLPGSANPLFPNDAGLEWQALVRLAGSSLAPEPLARDRARGFDVILTRRAAATGQAAPEVVAKALQHLHGLDAAFLPARLTSTEDICALALNLRALCGEAAGILPALPPGLPPAPSARTSFIHGDATPANVLGLPEGALLIDWQCPARGDPAFDLALWLSPGMRIAYGYAPATAAEAAAFLAAYADGTVIDRYLVLKPLWHGLLAAYCLWRSQAGEAAYATACEAELAALSA